MKKMLALAITTLTLVSCGKSDRAVLPAGTSTDTAVGVKVVKPQADAGTILRATGELRARHDAALSAEASGRILRFTVDVGARVKKGELLMELDASGARIQLAQARAARATAEAAHKLAVSDLRRTEELARGDAATPAILERAQIGEEQAAAVLQQATAAVAAAQDQLVKNTIRAPFDGLVTARYKSAGEFVSMMPPTPVLAMVDVSTVEIRAAVPESVVDLLAPGADLDATVSPSGKPFKARVRTVGATVDAGARTVDVRADPVGPLFKELRPGAIVEVRLGMAGRKVEGIFLPAEAVQQANGKSYVWVVVSSEAHKRPVEVKQLTSGTVRILSGISADDQVVAQGGAGLTDGARVRVQE